MSDLDIAMKEAAEKVAGEPSPPPVIDQEEVTDRLRALSEFAIGFTVGGDDGEPWKAADPADPRIADARDAAVLSAFAAIRRIAEDTAR